MTNNDILIARQMQIAAKGRGGSVKPNVKLNINFTDTQFVIKLKLKIGNSILLSWGDGSSENIDGQGDTLITKISNYNSPAVYLFTIHGDKLSYIDISGQAFVSGNISEWNKYTTLREPLVSFQLDDGYVQDYSTVLSLFKTKGQVACSAIITSSIGQTGKLTQAQILDLQSEGWEILSHTVNHPDLTTVSAEVLTSELADSKTYLESIGCVVESVVYPQGKYNAAVEAETLLHYRAGYRSVSYFPTTRGFVTYPVNLASLERCNTGDNQLSIWETAVDECFNTYRNAALVFYNHGFYIDLNLVGQLLDYIISKGLTLKTSKQILDRIDTYNEIDLLLSGTGITFDTLSNWTSADKTIDLSDLGWDSTMVDRALNALSYDCHGCTISLDGTNQARTSNSDAAIIKLNQNGNTVNVNNGYLTLESIQVATIDQIALTYKIDSGKNIYINWGEGDSILLTADGTNKTITSQYTTANKSYVITIFGEIEYLRTFQLGNEYTLKISVTQFKKCTRLNTLSIAGTNSTIGDISELVSLTNLQDNAANNIGGAITNLIELLSISVQGTNTLSGSINGLTKATFVLLAGNNTVTGNIENLNTACTYIVIQSTGNTVVYGGGATKAWANTNITISSRWTTIMVDAFLNAYALTAGAGTKTIDLSGNNSPRSSASDAAVTTLQGLGKTIITN